MKFYTLLFIATILSFACRQEVTVTPVENQNIDLSNEWPQIQEEVENIYAHYEAYLPNSLAYSEEQLGAKRAGKWGVIDKENRLHFPFEYDTIVSSNSNIALKKGGTFYLYDTTRQEIAEIKADEMSAVMSDFFIADRGGSKTLVNPNGMLIQGLTFQAITGPKDGSYFLGRQDSVWKAYDLAGNVLTREERGEEAARWLNEYSVGLKSYGPLKMGMTRDEIERNVGWKLEQVYGNDNCSLLSLGSDFLGVQLMINKEVAGTSTLERIYIEDEEVSTRSGIKIGSSAAEVKKVYGVKIESEENEYNEEAEDLFYVPTDRKDKNYRLNFLSEKGSVTSYSLGRLPSIRFVEGCL